MEAMETYPISTHGPRKVVELDNDNFEIQNPLEDPLSSTKGIQFSSGKSQCMICVICSKIEFFSIFRKDAYTRFLKVIFFFSFCRPKKSFQCLNNVIVTTERSIDAETKFKRCYVST